jgi:periplasmic protein TonB
MTAAATPSTTTPFAHRNLLIAAAVLVCHVLALWALQAGLLHRAVEVLVPAQLLSEFIEPPRPRIEPPPVPLPREIPPPPKTVVPLKREPPTVQPPPMPVAVATPDPTPAPNAPVGVVAPQAPLPPIAAPVKAEAAPAPAPAPTPPAPPKVVLPSSDADYLQNPKPTYPAMSKRLNEQGKVMVRVLIGADGLPQKAELRQSSGFERLDQSAMTTVMQWRYVPGKRDGMAEAMWFVVPITFVLE